MRGYRSNWGIEKSLAVVSEVKIDGRPRQDRAGKALSLIEAEIRIHKEEDK